MNKFLISITVVTLISSCSKDDGLDSPIVGDWKLTEASIIGFGGISKIDYSDQEIIYQFLSNGTLVVSNDNVGHTSGEYLYTFKEDELFGSGSQILVEIDQSKWIYTLTNGQMVLGLSYVDGPDLTFERP